MLKVVPDNYWNDEVKPKLYPLWDTEKDRLVEFSWYDNNTYHCIRRKFIKILKLMSMSGETMKLNKLM